MPKNVARSDLDWLTQITKTWGSFVKEICEYSASVSMDYRNGFKLSCKPKG